MRSERNTKEDFLKHIKERINDGRWGLDEVDYLLENHSKYHLNYEDIGILLGDVFKYTYNMAMEDGVLNQLELDELTQIQKLTMNPIPGNKTQREDMKFQIRLLTRKIQYTHGLQDQAQLTEELENKYELEKEPVKERVNSIYYRNPRPKLTPYTYY